MRAFAAFGDSITEPLNSFAYINDRDDTVYAADNVRSWVPYASGAGLQYVGGFARGGNRSTQIAAGASPVLADVAVIMVGTNDIGPAPWGVPIGDSLAAIRTIVTASRAPVALVCAIAPRNGAEAARTQQYNAAVRSFVTGMGWSWTDPWTTLRAPDGQWQHSSLTYDGVHPVWQSAQRAGQKIREAIVPLLPPLHIGRHSTLRAIDPTIPPGV